MDVVGFLLCGVLGLLAHWCKRWLRGQTDAGLYEYYMVRERKATVTTLLTFVVSLFGFLAGGPEWSMGTAYGAFSVGYLIDSAVNAG